MKYVVYWTEEPNRVKPTPVRDSATISATLNEAYRKLEELMASYPGWKGHVEEYK